MERGEKRAKQTLKMGKKITKDDLKSGMHFRHHTSVFKITIKDDYFIASWDDSNGKGWSKFSLSKAIDKINNGYWTLIDKT